MRRNPSMPSHPWAMLRRKLPDTMTFPSTRVSSPGVIPLMIFEPAPALSNVDEKRRGPGTGRIVNALSDEKDQKEQEEKSHFPPIVSGERS